MKRAALTAATATLLGLAAAGCGGPGDQSSEIAAKIGPNATCSAENWTVKSKLDGSEARIYNCSIGSGPSMCVTYEGGIAKDSTAVVRLLFANALSKDRPACLH